MESHGIDLYWLPVAAGTSRAQRWSLRLWETFEAARARRQRAELYHAALKVRLHGQVLALELAPAFENHGEPVLATGPVGMRMFGRSRLFRYELRTVAGGVLPDEQWAGPALTLPASATDCQRLMDLAREVPPYTWGRRAPGTSEMWTSDSVVSWLLVRSGIDLSRVQPPAGGRAPGWDAGVAVARRCGAGTQMTPSAA